MKKLTILITLAIVLSLSSISYANMFVKWETPWKVNGDTIIGYQKDVKMFQECEQFVMNWFADKGYNLSYDVTIEFTSNVEKRLGIQEKEGFTLKGGFLHGKNKIYTIRQKHIIVHELMHYYLFNYGIYSKIIHEQMATFIEIDFLGIKYQNTIIKMGNTLVNKIIEAENMLATWSPTVKSRMKLEIQLIKYIVKYIYNISNYNKSPEDFQILVYWAYKRYNGQQMIDKKMSTTN